MRLLGRIWHSRVRTYETLLEVGRSFDDPYVRTIDYLYT